MKLKTVLEALRRIAPEGLAESWDKVGLRVGSENQHVRRAMLCIDMTEDVMAEAVAAKTNLIVAYHPPIFEPLARLTDGDWKQRIIRTAVQKNIAVYSPHTALDAAEGGVNDWLVEGVGKGDVWAIVRPGPRENAISYNPQKIVTFVPPEHADKVREAMAREGAGEIGQYKRCSFSTMGEGTFQGEESTSPAVGKAGQFKRVKELRLEMVCWPLFLNSALRALKEAHPYEEPAIDVYELMDVPCYLDDTPVGMGRYVTLERPVSLSALMTRMKKHLGVEHVEVAKPQAASRIQRVGVCAGAGGSVLKEVIRWRRPRVGAFITGEMRHHDVLDAVARGISVILAGHTQTERPYMKVYRQRLAAETGPAVRWSISKRDRPPTVIR